MSEPCGAATEHEVMRTREHLTVCPICNLDLTRRPHSARRDGGDLVMSESELGRCHECGHWRTSHCNVDGFAYCDDHYPEGLR